MTTISTQYTRSYLDRWAKELAREHKIVRHYWSLTVTERGATLHIIGTRRGEPGRIIDVPVSI
jgi:hypothetical protein